MVVSLASCVTAGNDGAVLSSGPAGGGDPRASALGSYLAGRVARVQGDTQAAAEFYRLALEDDPDNMNLLRRTFLAMLSEGQMAQAGELAARRTALAERSPMADVVLAVDDIRHRRWDAARPRLDTAERSGFAALLKPLMLAWVEAAEGRFDEAEAALAKLEQRTAFDAFRNFHLALVNDFAGRDTQAASAYKRTRDSAAGNSTRVVLAYGSFLTRRDRHEEAEKLFRTYLRRVPNNPVITQALADTEAGKQLDPLVQSASEGVGEAFYGAAGALAQDQRGGNTSLIYVRLALYTRPQFDFAQMLLGEMMESVRRWHEAAAVYRDVQATSPFHWEARIRTARVLNRLDKAGEAITMLQQMSKERPADNDALVEVADILRGRERYGEAVHEYDRAIDRISQLRERDWVLLYTRGMALERSKQWDRAEADFLHALELKPNQPSVLNYLGYSWVEQGRNMERAREMIERAVAQRPNDGYIVDSLGWVLFRLGRYEDSVRHLERAVELQPQDPIINDHLGDAYWRVGRHLEARFQWRHALSLQPDKERVDGIQAKLEQGLAPVVDRERDG